MRQRTGGEGTLERALCLMGSEGVGPGILGRPSEGD
jgi:hypothetical protein